MAPTSKRERRIRVLSLAAMALIALTLLSMARLYVGAQSSQANIALAMRQVSEVAWRVKDLEMWTRLSVSEAGTDGGSPDRAAAFALSNAKGFVRLPGIECQDPPKLFSGGQIRGIIGPKAERVSPRMTVRLGGEAMAFRAENGGDLIVG